MPDDSLTHNSSQLEAALVQELDFLKPGAVVVLGSPHLDVLIGVAPSVFSWLEPRALCELVIEVARELQPMAAVGVWLLDEDAFARARGALGEQLAQGTLDWLARSSAAGFETRSISQPEEAWSRTAVELAGLAAGLLNVPGLSPLEQLFARGVDSVLCVRLMSHVRERWGVELELRDVLDAPRIAELAERIEQLQGGAVASKIERVARDRAWPLSAAQLRMWLLSSLLEAGPAQHVTGGLRLSGVLDLAALKRAAERLSARHESLRTVFEEQAGVPVQRVLAELPVAFRVEQIAGLDDAACVRAAAEPAFDFARGPLWRVWLYERGAHEHLMVLCMHHVISDGWSMELAARELLQLYAAETLPELDVQYLDYVAWERAQDARLAAQIAYWREQLVAEAPPLELPRTLPRRQRVARSGRAGRSVAFELDPALTAQLRTLAAEQSSSLFAVLLAGFQLWLSRMTGRDQIRVGVPVLGRQRAAAEHLIGCFVNTLVLSLDVEPAHDVATLVRTVDANLRGALAHADVPFETLVRELGAQRSAEHTPLFQVTYNHLRASAPATIAGLRVERLAREPVGSPFVLSLETEEFADGSVRALFNYPVETFAPETVRELAELYVGLLWQMVSGSARRVSELPLLSRAELMQLSAAHETHASILPDEPIHELVVRQALKRPEVDALVGGGERWTFAEIERKSRALALSLRALGVGPDVPVGIYVPRGPRMIVAALGILRAGGAYVPLDMSYPAERLAFIVRDSQIGIVLCGSGELGVAADSGRCSAENVRSVALDSLLAEERDEPLPHVAVHPGQLAYVIYTSGSTGNPKGVGVGHGSLQMHLRATGALYDFDENDCALHFSSFSFDAAVENWAMPLTHGARLVISDAEAWTGAQTYDVVQRERVNVVFPPTAHLRLLSQHVLDAGAAGQILRAVCVGGEAVLREDHALIMRALGPSRFINGYGPTECVVTPLLWRSFERETPDQSYAPIGRPVGERRVYLLDADLMPVPVGVVGEVYIAGGHARGYHARPALTAECFVPDPFSDRPGGRLYRTGDFGRWLPSGDVEYVGRRDAQVKLRGFRIELGEIESCLRQFPEVSDAVVVLDEAVGSKRLIGYVELPTGGDVNALRAHASASLPEYMVPAQIVVLSALPKTPNGKVDRRALPQPEAAARSSYAAPETETERALARIWSDVLGIETVGLDDNFFELGGDSIIALQLVGRARAEQLALHVRSVFEHQTLRALARASAEASPLKAAVIAPQQARVSLTPIQRLFFGLALPNSSHFNQALLLGLRRSIDPDVLSEALSTLVLRHPALRLCMRREEPRYLRVEELERDHLLEVCDVTSDAHALAVIQAAQRSLDLSQGQLLRAVLLREPTRERLLLVVHHLASDGVSLRVLLEELASACDSHALEPPSVDPGRWAERLEAWSKEEQLLEQRVFWSEQLQGGALQGVAPICDRVGACQALSLRLDADRTAKLLREAGRPFRLRTNELLLTALVRAVQRWNGQTSLSVQLEGHGRDSRWNDLDPSRSVGWFTCVYPLALDYHGEIGANLRAIKECVRGVPDAGLGYGVLTQLSSGACVQHAGAAPSITFNYLGQLDDSFDARRSPFELLSIEPGDSVDPAASAASPIVIDAWVASGELSLRWTVSPSALPLAAAESLLAAYERELHDVIAQAVVALPVLTPSDLPYVRLSQAELDALPSAVENVFPTSALQQGMLFHAATEPDSSAYVNALAFELRGVTPAALERAFCAAVARHPALRSGFVWQSQREPLQVVLAHAELPVRHADLTSELDLTAARAQACKAERARRFELQDAPLARLYLGELPDARVLVIWTSHHLALDGWSAAGLLAEVLADASGVARSNAPVLGHDAILAWRARQASAGSEAFWRAQLRDLEEPCLLAPQLPERSAADGGGELRGLPASQRSELLAAGGGGEVAFRLTGVAYEQLRRCAQALHVTPNTLIQAAWLLLLERYTGRDVVSCGITVSGRPAELPGSESLIGMYINTLPLVHKIEAAERVDAWLTRLMRENLALREHEHSALSDIQRWAALSGRALFDSLVVFENYPIEEALRGADQALAPAALEVFEETSFAFTLRVQQAQAALDFVLAYPLARLDAVDATRLGERFMRVLAQIASEPARRVGELALVDAVDTTRLAQLDATVHALPEAAFVADSISAQAQARSSATALVFDGVSRSYAELEARSTRLARRLRALGVRSDARVAVLAERSFELVESLYAVLKSGGAYVPLDPELPSERIASMLADTAPRVLLTQRAQLSKHSALESFAPCLILDELDWQTGSSEPLEVTQHPEDLAYVIYTSGSTGKPKGAGNTQRGLANRLAWMQATFQLTPDDVVLQKTPYSFDVSVWEFFWPLMTGSTLVIAAPGDHREPQRLAALIADQRVTTLHFVPSMLRAFVEAADPALCGSLRRVICSGEALDALTVQRSQELLPAAELHNLYGPTEAAIDVTHWACGDAATPSVPIGRPIWNTKVYVLDAQLQRAPVGAIGELYLAGIQLARGYHGRPALTAERFLPDPWSAGARMYRTGDLGRHRADGAIEYLGRIDHQIKLRGYRIELGEIEAVLREQADVRDAVVVARHDAGNTRLVGYVALHVHVDLDSLFTELRARLPEYMVPAQLVVLPELPLTSSGKVDRRALPAPERRERQQRAASTPREAQLLEIWRAMLSAPDAGVDDDFFELGGDSLLSLQIIARARGLGLTLTPRQLFEARSVAALAALSGDVAAPVETIARVSRDQWQPLSHAQERMWFLAQLEPDSAAYNISGAVRVNGALDVLQLRAAFEQLVARHEALRTSFEEHDGRGMQRVHAHAALVLRTLNVRGPEAEQLARDAFAHEASRPFRLADRSLLRLLLIGLGRQQHVLVLTMHHLVSDAGTIATLLSELQALYAGQPLTAAPALQYVDYAVWQHSALSAADLSRQLDYFRAQLGAEHPLIALPTDRPRPAAQSYRGAGVRFALDAETSRGVQRLGRELGASTFMVLLSAFEAVLYRLTGQRDLRVGIPISRRSRVELEGVVGLFVNTLVLRAELDGPSTFAELLAQLKQVSLDAQANSDLPFERLVEALSPERSLSHNPLFQVMFDHQRAPLSGVAKLGALALSPFEKSDSSTQLDLGLETFGDGDQIFGHFTYATDLFDHATVEALCERFVRTLRQVVAEPSRKLAELELLADSEAAWLLGAGTPQLEAADAAQPFVHVRIDQHAAMQPSELALEGETGEPWTYAQLRKLSNQWAQRLRELGVGPESKVGLCVSRSPRMVMGALAILKAGAAYVPLDPTYPVSRLRAVVEDAGVQLIVGELQVPVSMQLGAAKVVLCDHDCVSGYPSERPQVALSFENLAYIVYTSGSTGRPKGVGVSHGALAQHVAAVGRDYGMQRTDCSLHFASIGFDAGTEQWVSPLVHGARLFIRGDELWSAERALDVLRERGVTWFEMPPGYLLEISRAALERGERIQLRACSAGGEAVSRDSLQVMMQAVSPAPVINGYGPTETVITPMTWHAREITQCNTAYAPIGRVVGPRRSYVLDADLNLVPVGVTGELYLGGLSLARGYMGRPDLSAERFVPDPFAQVAGARMYRTGDLARVLADGNVEYVGRADHQVKVRGFRVELGEIEAQLLAQPGVREVVVVADGGAVAARLLGYVAGDVDVEQLRTQLRAALPEYMVPAQLIVLPQLPRNSNGKVDRQQLPVPEDRARVYQAPRSELESQLCAIMAEVLHVERVGRDDDFFELGGDSIRSLQVISRARKLGLALSPRDMFRCRGVAELAQCAAPTAPGPELQPLARDTDLFRLSYAQERLWFLAQLAPDSAAYNISGAVRVRGPLDTAALSAALSALTARHEALRTTFEAHDGQPWQRVHAQSSVTLELHDCCCGGPVPAEDQARLQVEAAADATFDLVHGPLVRVLALRVSSDEHVLCLVMHHIISDGWSLDTAIAELSQLYAAKRSAQSARLPALRVQYVDYAAWQRTWLLGDELARQLDYWRVTLGTDHPVLSLPCDHTRPQIPTQRGDVVDFALSAAQSGKLQALAREHDTTVFVVMLAAFQTVLHRLSGQREVRVGVPVTNRNRLETEAVLGLFVNTQVLRSDYDPSRSFAEIVRRTRETALSAQAHQDVPFERLVEVLQPARSMGHNPLFQVMYNHLRRTDALFAGSSELQAASFVWNSQWSQFDLTLDTEEAQDGVISGRLTYATDLFVRATAERWAAQFVRALDQLIDARTSAVGSVSWLAPEERAAQLKAAAGQRGLVAHARGVAEQGPLLHERIREQALRHRSRIACSYEGEQLSYGALELRANQWAQRLVKLGVGPDVLVGLCVERSLDLVVGVLAILKAGGAYVPLDPSAPADRVSYMIEDSRLSLVLTQDALLPRFAGLTALCLDREDVRAESNEPPVTQTRPDQLAYVIYTSGSTGKPKGALLTHHNVTRLFDVTLPSFGFDERDVWTLFHSYAFDFSVWEIFGALLYGGCVVVVPYDVSRSPADFYALLVREGVTVLNQTPSAFRQLAAVACAAPSSALKLRRVIFGGEALELEALRPWFERFGDQQPQLINMYGITETTVHVTYRPVALSDLQNASVSPIGEPIDDLVLYVLDEALEPCAWGVTGELYVGGSGLARGYLRRPALSAERFVPNPFGPGRLYRSGDLALRRENGALEYLGRSDHQVKIRGFRIELGEIASQLQAHPAVREASVIARPGPSGQRLLGYVTCHADREPDVVDVLKQHLRRVLPEYMVPASLIVLDELPLTVNGKLDQARLPEQSQRALSFVPPSTEIERQLAEIWTELLGVERVGKSDDFFELGGHSLLVTQVLSRVQRQFGVALQLRTLFDASTLHGLAARIDEAGASSQSPESQLDALDALLSDLENEA